MGLKSKLLCTAAMMLMATQASAEALTLKFGHVGKPGSLFEASVNEFARCSARLNAGAQTELFGTSLELHEHGVVTNFDYSGRAKAYLP